MMEKNTKELKKSHPNIWFLNKSKVVINGITFLGTTLWTNIQKSKEKNIKTAMNDYSKIYSKRNILFITDNCSDLYADQIQWIKENITKSNTDTIIITHHLPTQQLSHPKYAQFIQKLKMILSVTK